MMQKSFLGIYVKNCAVFCAVLCTVLCVSCSPEEPFIDSYDDTWRFISSMNGSVSARMMPAGDVISANVIPASTDTSAMQIRVFRDNIYFCTSGKIEIVNRITLAAVGTIILDTLGSAHDIAFANATTAYATHPEKNIVSVIDITVNKVVRTIGVARQPRGIVALGNQICVACAGDNKVNVIDSRENAVTASYDVAPTPWYVDVDIENNVFGVLSLGDGKISEAVKTPPVYTAIDVIKQSVVGHIEISARNATSSELFPTGMVITPAGYAFIPVQKAVVRVSTRIRGAVSTVLQESYGSISYNPARAEVLLMRTSADEGGAFGLEVYDTFFEGMRTSVPMPAPVQSFVGISR